MLSPLFFSSYSKQRFLLLCSYRDTVALEGISSSCTPWRGMGSQPHGWQRDVPSALLTDVLFFDHGSLYLLQMQRTTTFSPTRSTDMVWSGWSHFVRVERIHEGTEALSVQGGGGLSPSTHDLIEAISTIKMNRTAINPAVIQSASPIDLTVWDLHCTTRYRRQGHLPPDLLPGRQRPRESPRQGRWRPGTRSRSRCADGRTH